MQTRFTFHSSAAALRTGRPSRESAVICRGIPLIVVALCFTSFCFGQKDSGVRGGPPGAGGHLPNLTANELALFFEGKLRTTQLEAVCDDCNDVTLGADTGQDPNFATLTNSSGLGARFNGDQCSVCHQ